MKNSTILTVDTESLRSAMRAWSAGVTVVTAAHEGQIHGMTVNSFTSISLDPALITISLQQNSRTHELISKSQAFGVTILSNEQAVISNIFAGRVPEASNRFANLQTETLVTGSPLIVGGLAWLDCRVIETFDAGMNMLFIAEVVAARSMDAGEPLVYHNREYWKLSKFK
ncbi:MAG: flavin reductase family protein [Anaerolineales bacterium]|nr:flavin reductase family protein [Anaerolineales bacterium]